MRPFYILLLFISFNASAQVPPYTVSVDSGNAPSGYYFLEAIALTHPGTCNTILDSAGNVVYYKNFHHACYGLVVQPNGLMSYYDDSLLVFLLMDSTFNVIDTIRAQNGYSTDEHELLILPNGHYLLLAEEDTTENLSSYDYFNNDSTPGDTAATVICAIIQELDTNKNVVFEWHAKDHLPFDGVDPFFLSSPSLVDWTHSNALGVDTDGNILMSVRQFNAIVKVNRLDSSIMWQFGGKYSNFAWTGSDSVPFYGQHDIRSLSNGHYTLYDDGNHYTPHGARACEYQLNTTNMTAQLAWSYTYDSSMFSEATGSVQRLQSASGPLTLTDYGIINKVSNVCFDVVDSSGTEVFKLFFNDTLFSYRTFNYSSLPWALNRPQVSCLATYSTLYLSATGSYSSYLWSNGSTSQTITVTTPGTYYVFVPYGEGGYISSQPITITDINTFCTPTAVTEVTPNDNIKIFPNPAHNMITISGNASENNVSPYIKDISGRLVSMPETGRDSNSNAITYDVSSLADGFYIISVNGEAFKFIKN